MVKKNRRLEARLSQFRASLTPENKMGNKDRRKEKKKPKQSKDKPKSPAQSKGSFVQPK